MVDNGLAIKTPLGSEQRTVSNRFDVYKMKIKPSISKHTISERSRKQKPFIKIARRILISSSLSLP